MLNKIYLITRGEVGGYNGRTRRKGYKGTCIKGTWTKPKGVGSSVGGGDGWSWGKCWEENEDNCT